MLGVWVERGRERGGLWRGRVWREGARGRVGRRDGRGREVREGKGRAGLGEGGVGKWRTDRLKSYVVTMRTFAWNM